MDDALASIANALSGSIADSSMIVSQIVPALLSSILILITGVVIAHIAGWVVKKIIRFDALETWFEDRGIYFLSREIDVASWLAAIVKWFILIIFFVQALAVVNLDVLRTLGERAVFYSPVLIAALLIVVIGWLIVRSVRAKIVHSKMPYRRQVAAITEIILFYAVIVTAMETAGLKVTALVELMKIVLLVIGITAAIIVGIPIGISLRPEIEKIIRDVRKGSRKSRKEP
ncbi:hypothetical protein COT48_02265 [Candidatus Woesearchaeota archaeon CG08_land_8_20_14_0_20_47_9]|nr:MAG: hypothetical protein AUJ69_02885 [Candidatus Woesearchaeota archaeon CG1_02_47_18]PIO04071.1 MAG: hypothetical protein COT48_02265 [Candidatus Woesearchaeota archaeon CG08_land_8_20_14_0_20_47_9]